MKVLHIQTSMTPAGNAAYRLHLAMRRAGIESFVMTYKPALKANYVSSLKGGWKVLESKIATRLFQRTIKKKDLIPNSYSFSVLPILSKGMAQSEQVRNADVIYLHWICGGFLSYNDIQELAETGKPVFFFMHDMWTFTGGCHHSFDCRQYETGCQDCPMFRKKTNVAKKQGKKKKELFEKFDNFCFISPSQWMAECARQSFVLENKPVYSIPNVVDESIFKPIPKSVARNILYLPQDKKIISFGCQATANPFKGWQYLQRAINLLEEENIHILVYGSDYDEETARQLKYPISFMGKILDEHVLAIINSASDVFVSPSLAESFGLTFLENILCGTPVVGFDNTAVSEIVITGKTGYLANNKDEEDLRNGILKLLSCPIRPEMEKPYKSSEIAEMHQDILKMALCQVKQ